MQYGVTAFGVCLLTALTGCDGASQEAGPASVTPSPPVIDCGTLTQRQGEAMSVEAANCLMEAMAAGTPARLEQTFPTTEGAPITQTYRTTGSRRVRVVTDSTRDPLGSAGIVTRTCTGQRRSFFVLEFASCTARRTGRER